jgi:hypothetical protein
MLKRIQRTMTTSQSQGERKSTTHDYKQPRGEMGGTRQKNATGEISATALARALTRFGAFRGGFC